MGSRPDLADAIVRILSASQTPLDPREVLKRLLEDGAYEFRTKDPHGIVRNCLSRHAIQNTHSCSSKRKLFHRCDDGRFEVAE